MALNPDFNFDGEGLAALLERSLPERARTILEEAAGVAAERGWRIYLGGGYVRDLFLRRANYDIDISVEGEAIALARALQGRTGGRLKVADRFGTAHLEFGDGTPHMDLVTARKENYSAPGALPTVEPGDIFDDLARRDFTINAMAIRIDSGGTRQMLDPHGGLDDLQARIVRVLHDRSFIDDPTRIFRAVKYAVRLGFKIAPETLELIAQAIRDGALGTVSMDRLSRELLLVMEEPNAGAMLARLEELGVLRAVHAELAWPYTPESQVGPTETPNLKPEERRDTYLAILGAEYAGFPDEAGQLARALGLDAPLTRLVRDSARLAALWAELGEELPASQVYNLLKVLDPAALQAYARIGAMAADKLAWGHLHDYLDRLRHIRPAVSGDYLRAMDLPPGPVYKRLLGDLQAAKLDGKVRTREDEERFVREWLEREDGE